MHTVTLFKKFKCQVDEMRTVMKAKAASRHSKDNRHES